MTNPFDQILANLASVALAVEALEAALIEKGLLAPDELMQRLEKLAASKALAENAISLPLGSKKHEKSGLIVIPGGK